MVCKNVCKGSMTNTTRGLEHVVTKRMPNANAVIRVDIIL